MAKNKHEERRSLIYLGIILGLIWIFGIELGLFLSTLIASLVAICSYLPLINPLSDGQKKGIKEFRELSFMLLIILLVRSFIFQPFRVPTGSLEPTVKPGDFILVKQWAYGLRLPLLHHKIIGKEWTPKRGDIALFYWPKNPKIVFVKRIIGLPGDTISYANKRLTINGQPIAIQNQRMIDHQDEKGIHTTLIQAEERLPGRPHAILIDPETPPQFPQTWVIPKGYYFAMGDHRDNSDDSRYWGLVPDANLIGQARWIWMSWNPSALATGQYGHLIRLARIGQEVL